MPTRSKKNGGRPPRYTPAAALAIVAGVRAELSFEDATRAAAVGRSTVFRWMQAGRAGHPAFTPFLAAVEQAKAAWKAERAEWSRRQCLEESRRLDRILGGWKARIGDLFAAHLG